jgi:hypothetical protein
MKHFLDGIEVTPKNTEELEFTIDKTSNSMDVSINLTHLIFVNEAKKRIEQYIEANGYFKGIPYDIVFDNGFTLNFFLDQTDALKIRSAEIEIAIKKRYGNLEFWEILNATSFDSLGGTALIDGKTVKRVVISADQHLEILSLTANLMTISKSIIDRVYDFTDLFAAVTAVTGLSISMLIYSLIKTSAVIFKSISLLVEILLFIDRVDQFVNPEVEEFNVESLKSILINNLYNVGIIVQENDFLDYFENIAYIGTTYREQISTAFSFEIIERKPNGTPTSLDYFKQATFDFTSIGGFVSWFLAAFNAKIRRVDNFTIQIVRRDDMNGVINGIISALPLQETRSVEFTPNTNENWQRCLVKYNLDDSELYTSYLANESASEWRTEKPNLLIMSGGLNLVRGYKEIDMMFSQGFAYNSVNVNHWNFIYEVKNKLSKWFTNSKLENYISGTNPYEGFLVTSSYTYNIPKIVRLIGDGKISALTALEVFKEFHEIDFIKNNSFMIHRNELVECNDNLFVNLLNNDNAEINGDICQLEQINYNPIRKSGKLIYKRPSNYADDLALIQVK